VARANLSDALTECAALLDSDRGDKENAHSFRDDTSGDDVCADCGEGEENAAHEAKKEGA
jgi:hypothetical protein